MFCLLTSLLLFLLQIRYPGARNDAYIWSTSPIRRAMEFHYNRGERRTWLIGKLWCHTVYFAYILMLHKRPKIEKKNIFMTVLRVLTKRSWRCKILSLGVLAEHGRCWKIWATILTLHWLRLVNTLSAVKGKIFFTVQQSSISSVWVLYT